MMKKGILLTGGEGTRVKPHSTVYNKHLLYLNKKFVIDYPINTLKSMGCEDIIIVLGGSHYSQVVSYLGDGSDFELNFNFVYQKHPSGISQAINMCKNFVINENNFPVVLGDNVFENTPRFFKDDKNNAQIMLADHPSLTRFGVASIDNNKNIVKIEEKPKELDINYHNYAISGCYLFNSRFFDFFQESKPSKRNEFEITDIIDKYHKENQLSYTYVSGLWSDAGTHESISYINHYFYTKEHGICQK